MSHAGTAHNLSARALVGPVTLRGTGLFAPLPVELTIGPHGAPDDAHDDAHHAAPAIRFCRTDLPDAPCVFAHARNIAPPSRAGGFGRNTVLLSHLASVHTTEHFLSAAYVLALFDLHATINGPELPLLDGSALTFFDALSTHARPMPAPRAPERIATPAPLVVRGPLRVTGEHGAFIEARPRADDHPPRALVIDYTLDYGQAAQGCGLLGAAGPRHARFVLDWDDPEGTAARYREQIAPARTFCTLAEAEGFRAKGFFAHVDTRHVLVLGPEASYPQGIASGGPLTVPDEPARHKLLDALGDLALVARPIVGHIVAHKSGHPLNHAMAHQLLNAFG